MTNPNKKDDNMKRTLTKTKMTPIAGNATTPEGFLAHGLHCGARRKRKDLALLYCEKQASVAGLYTTNQIVAAPVEVCRAHTDTGYARAILVNSGNANACTGPQGKQDAHEMVELMALQLGVDKTDILLASTGLIGSTLPMEPLRKGIAMVADGLKRSGGQLAAEAIMTTDAFTKTTALKVEFEDKSFLIGGMAKGAGMIHPSLATTLCFLTTDAEIEPVLLKTALKSATDVSFNSITVDGDTSTNDSILVMASGESGVKIEQGPTLDAFTEALTIVATELAKLVVKDGEGARRLVELQVTGARTADEARQVADTIASSLLFKTMLVGGEPNWGRVIAATGRSGVPIDPDSLNLWFSGVEVVKDGCGLQANLALAGAALQQPEVVVHLDLGLGKQEATVWTCDINENYVVLNGSYMT